MNKDERKELSTYLENYGAYDLADEFNTQVYMVNTQEFNDLVLLYYFRQKDEIDILQRRIDKAIEYIEKEYYSKNTTDINSIGITTNKLLQIRKMLKEVSE